MKKLNYSALAILILISIAANASETISYYDLKLQSVAITAAFYSASSALLIVFALFNVASRNRIGLWYTLQFAIGLFFVACIDGTAQHYLWPGNPELTNWVPLTALLLLNGNGLILAVVTSKEEATPLMNRLRGTFEVMGLLSLLCIALIPFVPIILLALVANLFFFPMVVSQVLSAMSWRPPGNNLGERQYIYAGRFSRITGLLFTLVVLLVSIIAFYQMSKDEFSYVDLVHPAVRLTYLILSLSLVATYLAHIIGIRRDHEDALQRELQSARREAQASEDKLLAEREFSRMRELAGRRRQKLSEASHDIRQPLVSLRLTLDKLKHSAGFADNLEYQQALAYIDKLADSFSEGANEADETPLSDSPTPATEHMPMNLLQQTITQMFAEEAGSKGIRLRTVPTSLSANVNPVAVMRIASNLVSNAIAHSGSAKILIGCRRAGNELVLEVHDQGHELTAEQFEHYKTTGVKGSDSNGLGLGLASCAELAEDNGYALYWKPTPLSPNCIALRLPRV